jgi:hypothetical protein
MMKIRPGASAKTMGCAESRRAIFVPFAECLGEQGHGAPQHRRHGTSILPALTAE